MNYTIKAHPTIYRGVEFRSRLEARYAAFFDLLDWRWSYEPLDLVGWTPDFGVGIPCGHSECVAAGETLMHHELLVEVKPYGDAVMFGGHPMWKHSQEWTPPHVVGLGLNPEVCTQWEMVHGAGGGVERVLNWVGNDWLSLWKRAGNAVMFRPCVPGAAHRPRNLTPAEEEAARVGELEAARAYVGRRERERDDLVTEVASRLGLIAPPPKATA